MLHTSTRLEWAAALIIFATATSTAGATDHPRQPPPAAARTVTGVLQKTLTPHWIDNDSFWFRQQNTDGTSTKIRVDAATGDQTDVGADARLDHDRGRLRFGSATRHSGSTGAATEFTLINQTKQALRLFWIDNTGKHIPYATIAPDQRHLQTTYAAHVWEIVGADKTTYGHFVANKEPIHLVVESPATKNADDQSSSGDEILGSQPTPNDSRPNRPANWSTGVGSPTEPSVTGRLKDGKLQLRIGPESDWQTLVTDDSVAQQYAGKHEFPEATTRIVSPRWTPDGKVLTAKVRFAVRGRTVGLIESSPRRGGRAKVTQRRYDLPGDPMDQFVYIAFHRDTGEAIPLHLPIVTEHFYRHQWAGPHRFILEVVDRGHQRFRLFTVDAISGKIETVVDDLSNTFIWTAHKSDIARWTYLPTSDEVIWVSEKDGYQHLYLVDLAGVRPVRAITEGEFVVRGIEFIDQQNRTIDLVLSGVYDDQDPYLKHYARVDFSGENLTLMTDADGNHTANFSPDRTKLVVTHSRVDSLPVHELRHCDGTLITTLGGAKLSPDSATWNFPLVFNAKGRDGETDIWGIAYFPADYDRSLSNSYPVIESIYAGPHGSHVPKSFQSSNPFNDYLDAGFVVVQIDAMGTANRSKKFHDVCWQDLKDAGFPDRIAWIKALAAKHPAIDLQRVGIFGTSAGGQNVGSALLFHGDFYEAGVAACGCHDNRMDKASWNEQWMGYPVGEQYSASSNVDNAARLQGDLFLIVGELDNNVPPESTLRFADALIKADKNFDMLVIPGLGHSDGGRYGRRRTLEFFIEKLGRGKSSDHRALFDHRVP